MSHNHLRCRTGVADDKPGLVPLPQVRVDAEHLHGLAADHVEQQPKSLRAAHMAAVGRNQRLLRQIAVAEGIEHVPDIVRGHSGRNLKLPADAADGRDAPADVVGIPSPLQIQVGGGQRDDPHPRVSHLAQHLPRPLRRVGRQAAAVSRRHPALPSHAHRGVRQHFQGHTLRPVRLVDVHVNIHIVFLGQGEHHVDVLPGILVRGGNPAHKLRPVRQRLVQRPDIARPVHQPLLGKRHDLDLHPARKFPLKPF